MVARPGRMQAAFTAGELDPALHGRTSSKFYANGVARMTNAVPIPQGGYELADGMRRVGRVSDAARVGCDFTASTGEVFDLVFAPGVIEMWSRTTKVFQIASPYTAARLPEVTFAQREDTLLVFHPDVRPRRLKYKSAANWELDNAPFKKIPNADYGAKIDGTPYENGVAAIWQIQLVGFNDAMYFALTINGEETDAISNRNPDGSNKGNSNLAPDIADALNSLSIVQSGITVEYEEPLKYNVTFVNNPGNDWALSGRVMNKPDAAIVSIRTRTGVAPGEPIMSNDRGWPSCGAFYQQRLIVGGFRSKPASFAVSMLADYYNFDERLKEANGSFVVPMDVGGGERILRIVAGRNLLIFTDEGEYWIENRAISKKDPPNIVQSSKHGSAAGVPVVENEGAALYVYAERGEIGEFRYADTEGSFVSTALSILGSHLVRGARDVAVRRSGRATSGNLLAVVADEGLSLATLLREQEVTGFGRRETDGQVLAVWSNGRNELSAIVERPVGGGKQRSLERFEVDLLLDGATTAVAAGLTVGGLNHHEEREVWATDGRSVMGPMTVAGGSITLPWTPVGPVTVGRWRPPLIRSLPPPRDVGPSIVVQRPIRIHSLQVSVQDTTSLALEVNGKPAKDVPLRRFGDLSDVGELTTPVTGIVCARGFTGFADEPFYDVTQVRPGRLRIRAGTAESSIS